MTAIDIVLLIILVIGCVRGVMKGFIIQTASLFGIVLGIYLARYYVGNMTQLFMEWFTITEKYAKPSAYAFIFIMVLVLTRIVAGYFDKSLNLGLLSAVNKTLGAIIGTFKYLLVLSVLLNVYDMLREAYHDGDEVEKPKSVLYEPVKSVFIKVFPYVEEADFSIVNVKDSNNSQNK